MRICIGPEGDGVHIRYLGNGGLWFRSYSGSLLNSAKVSKTLLPHHSAPRLGSVCPHSGFGPWAAVMGHPWPRTANPASCRVTHAPKPAFGQRGLTGRLRSKSRSKAKAQRPTGRLECLEAKSKAKAGTVQMWERACSRRSLTMTRAFWMNAALSGFSRASPLPQKSSSAFALVFDGAERLGYCAAFAK